MVSPTSSTVDFVGGAWKLLQALGPRDWQSCTFGLLELRFFIVFPDCLDNPSLDVFDLGYSSMSRIGFITVRPCTAFEGVTGVQEVVVNLELLCSYRRDVESRHWHLLSRRASGGRLIWKGERGEIDAWDSRLLDACRMSMDTIANRRYKIDHQLEVDLLDFASGCETQSEKTVGLCTAVMNRLWQVRIALPLTLAHCWKHRRWTKVHVVDFGSNDGTLCFLMQDCRAAIDVGLLSVYRCREQYWHASLAKNTSHMVSFEDILVNVDGDNIVGQNFPQEVLSHFRFGNGPVSYNAGGGTCGRIAYRRSDFLLVRGYDEDARPMGAQDVDLFKRICKLPGARKCYSGDRTKWSQAVQNTREEKVANCDQSLRHLTWAQMNDMNWEIFEQRRKSGLLRRNLERAVIGAPVLEVCFDMHRCQEVCQNGLLHMNEACASHGLQVSSPGLGAYSSVLLGDCFCLCACKHEQSLHCKHRLFGCQTWRTSRCCESEHIKQLLPYIFQDLPKDLSLEDLSDLEAARKHVARDTVQLAETIASQCRRAREARDRRKEMSEILRPSLLRATRNEEMTRNILLQLHDICAKFGPRCLACRQGGAMKAPSVWTVWLDSTGREYFWREGTDEVTWSTPPPPALILRGRC